MFYIVFMLFSAILFIKTSLINCYNGYILKAMEQRIKNGTTPRAWYREHAHTVLLPLDEEESHLLRSLIASAKQFYHYLSLIHHALDGQEAAELITIGNSLNGTMIKC